MVNYSWDFYFTRLKSFLKLTSIHNPGYLLQITEEKKLAYPECCKQAKNIGKPLKNLDIYSPQFHTKTNWTTCRDTSHLRAEHLLLFTPYSSTVYINQIHPYYFTHESRAHFLQYLEPLYSYLIPYYPIIWVIWIWV